VRHRARAGAAAVFPGPGEYGRTVFGAGSGGGSGAGPEPSEHGAVRIVPPVFVPERLEKLYDLGREPLPADVDLTASVGGFAAPLPLYVSAFGSTDVAEGDHGLAVSRQAGRLGIPMVIGENVIPVRARGHGESGPVEPVLRRIRAYTEGRPSSAASSSSRARRTPTPRSGTCSTATPPRGSCSTAAGSGSSSRSGRAPSRGSGG
jgi:hypothetical protein